MKGSSLFVFFFVILSLGAESSSDDLASLYYHKAWYLLENPAGFTFRAFHSPARGASAEKALATALSFKKDDSDTLWRQGKFYELTGRPSIAEKSYRESLKSNQFRSLGSILPLESLTTLLARQGRWQDLLDLWPRQQGGVFSPISAIAFLNAYYFSGQKEAFVGLLFQASGLSPEDDRFLDLMLRTPSSFPLLEKRLKKAKSQNRPLSRNRILQVLREFDRNNEDPVVLWSLLKGLGYNTPELSAWGRINGQESSESGLPMDYGLLIQLQDLQATKGPEMLTGTFFWDRSGDGITDQKINLAGTSLIWEKDEDQDGFWEICLSWKEGVLVSLEEKGQGANAVFTWEDYPYPLELRVRSREKTVVLDFGAYQRSMELWENPVGLGTPLWRIPSLLDGKLAFQMKPKAWSLETLTPLALRIKEYSPSGQWNKTAFQIEGQVFYSEEDLSLDGIRDRISFYLGGQLDALYLDPDQDGSWDIWEKHLDQGRKQLLGNLSGNRRTDWAFIDKESGGYQLWDYQGDGLADLQLFTFANGGTLEVLPLSRTKMEWGQMPQWEAPVK